MIKLDRHVERGRHSRAAGGAAPLAEDECCSVSFVGLLVEEESGRVLGRVKEVLVTLHDVLESRLRCALPLVEACVRQVDLEGGQIVVSAGFAAPVDQHRMRIDVFTQPHAYAW